MKQSEYKTDTFYRDGSLVFSLTEAVRSNGNSWYENGKPVLKNAIEITVRFTNDDKVSEEKLAEDIKNFLTKNF